MNTDPDTLAAVIGDFIRTRFPAARDGVGSDTPLLGLGLVDSLGIIDIVEFVEERFGIVIDDEELVADNFASIGGIARFTSAKLNGC